MMRYTMTREEQETVVTWNADKKTARVFTANPAVRRKLDRLVLEFPEAYQCVAVDEGWGTAWYEVPERYIRFGKPASEARREAGKRAAFNLRRENTETSEEEASDEV